MSVVSPQRTHAHNLRIARERGDQELEGAIMRHKAYLAMRPAETEEVVVQIAHASVCHRCKCVVGRTKALRRSICKPCAMLLKREYATKRLAARRALEAVPTRLSCSKCKLEKDVSEFYREPGSKRGYKYYCKTCHIRLVLDWRKRCEMNI